MKSLQIILGIVLFLVSSLTACTTTPTGRDQLTLVNPSQMQKLGDDSFSQLKKKTPRSKNRDQYNLVRCVSDHLLRAIAENPQQWEVEVFVDKTPNAFALPGNNIGVHTGMLDLLENQHQLAAVIGHEIGHVKARHGNERVSQNMVAQLGLGVAEIAIGGRESREDQLLLGALGVGTQVGILLPFSREHESEADRLGIEYMARAGFDPREAVKVWQLMKKRTGGGPAEFLSTHPSPQSRIKKLSQLAPKYMKDYQRVTHKPQCN